RSGHKNRLAQPGTEPCREDQARHSRPRAGPYGSLILSLIHPRTPASIGVYRRSLSRQVDHHGRSCTVIPHPEKRKVGGSTPPPTTPTCQGNLPFPLGNRRFC